MAIQFPAGATIANWFGKLFRSPFLWAGLLLVGAATGTWWYLTSDKKEAVQKAEEKGASDANNRANEETRAIEDKLEQATDEIIADNARLREQAAKDFERVRGQIETAPPEQREEHVAPLIIDTLNELDRLRADRDGNTDAVRDAKVPTR